MFGHEDKVATNPKSCEVSHGCSGGRNYKDALMGMPVKAPVVDKVALGPYLKDLGEEWADAKDEEEQSSDGWTTVVGKKATKWDAAQLAKGKGIETGVGNRPRSDAILEDPFSYLEEIYDDLMIEDSMAPSILLDSTETNGAIEGQEAAKGKGLATEVYKKDTQDSGEWDSLFGSSEDESSPKSDTESASNMETDVTEEKQEEDGSASVYFKWIPKRYRNQGTDEQEPISVVAPAVPVKSPRFMPLTPRKMPGGRAPGKQAHAK